MRSCVRVLPSGPIDAGCEITVDYSYLRHIPSSLRPAWYVAMLDATDEDGYYAHLQGKMAAHRPAAKRSNRLFGVEPARQLLDVWINVHIHSANSCSRRCTRRPPGTLTAAGTPPRALLSITSVAAAPDRVRVSEHGPWRVLWVGAVEQGMSYHKPQRNGGNEKRCESRLENKCSERVRTSKRRKSHQADMATGRKSLRATLLPSSRPAAPSADPVLAGSLVPEIVGFDYQRTM
eukprot:6191497-Pleurochrysis_carterae.AAC.1